MISEGEALNLIDTATADLPPLEIIFCFCDIQFTSISSSSSVSSSPRLWLPSVDRRFLYSPFLIPNSLALIPCSSSFARRRQHCETGYRFYLHFYCRHSFALSHYFLFFVLFISSYNLFANDRIDCCLTLPGTRFHLEASDSTSRPRPANIGSPCRSNGSFRYCLAPSSQVYKTKALDNRLASFFKS